MVHGWKLWRNVDLGDNHHFAIGYHWLAEPPSDFKIARAEISHCHMAKRGSNEGHLKANHPHESHEVFSSTSTARMTYPTSFTSRSHMNLFLRLRQTRGVFNHGSSRFFNVASSTWSVFHFPCLGLKTPQPSKCPKRWSKLGEKNCNKNGTFHIHCCSIDRAGCGCLHCFLVLMYIHQWFQWWPIYGNIYEYSLLSFYMCTYIYIYWIYGLCLMARTKDMHVYRTGLVRLRLASAAATATVMERRDASKQDPKAKASSKSS